MKFYTTEVRFINDLKPYENNARTHTNEQVEQIAESIRVFGFTNPLLIDEHNNLIAGHGRLEAAKKLGATELPCVLVSGLTKDERQALIIADNKLALNAGWNFDLLAKELEGMTTDFKNIIGFSSDELLQILGQGMEAVIDYPALEDGDREPFQTMSFILHDYQAELVQDTLTKARMNPQADDSLNENSNGNALAFICGEFLRTHE